MISIAFRSILWKSFVGAVSVSSFAMSQSYPRMIDTTLVSVADFNGDAKSDTVILRVMGEKMESPFKWSLTIRSMGQTLFFRTRTDSAIDGFFADEGYVGNCKGYLECKRRWYFHDFLPLFLVAPKEFLTLKESEVADYAKQFLVDSCNISVQQVPKVAKEIVRQVSSGRYTLINFPVGPGFGPVWVYVNRLKRFIPIWDD